MENWESVNEQHMEDKGVKLFLKLFTVKDPSLENRINDARSLVVSLRGCWKTSTRKEEEKNRGPKKKKSMKRGEYCVYKRLSGAIFSQTIFWFTANQQDCATRGGWKMHGVEIKEEKRYKYIFEVFFLFAMEGRKKRRARFAFGVEK